MLTEFQKISLRKERSLSELISVTFDLVRTNFRIIFLSFLVFCLPLYIPGTYFLGVYTNELATNIQGNPSAIFGGIGSLFLPYILLIAGTLLFYWAITAIITLYYEMDNPKMMTLNDVWGKILKSFASLLGASFIVGLITSFAFVFLIIPGIYFSIVFAFTFFIIMFESKGMGDAISRCFVVIKSNWWNTFGFLILIALIQFAISYTVSLPLGLVTIFIIAPANAGQDSSILEFLSILVSNIIPMAFSTLVSSITMVAISMKYFSLVEQKEKVGLHAEIEAMGETSNNTVE